jgi:hypothetical protein
MQWIICRQVYACPASDYACMAGRDAAAGRQSAQGQMDGVLGSACLMATDQHTSSILVVREAGPAM